jgi:predicted NBD/HSP70 family sugar kinase
MSANRVIGVDLGGTKIVARGSEAWHLLAVAARPTPTTSYKALRGGLGVPVRELPLDGVTAVGFGIPSRIDHQRHIALGAVNIPLHDVPFEDEMRARLDLPVGV